MCGWTQTPWSIPCHQTDLGGPIASLSLDNFRLQLGREASLFRPSFMIGWGVPFGAASLPWVFANSQDWFTFSAPHYHGLLAWLNAGMAQWLVLLSIDIQRSTTLASFVSPCCVSLNPSRIQGACLMAHPSLWRPAAEFDLPRRTGRSLRHEENTELWELRTSLLDESYGYMIHNILHMWYIIYHIFIRLTAIWL